MTRVYKQVSLEEAQKLRVPETDDYTYSDPYWTNVVYEELDGHPIKLLGVDGGEMEDQSLSRDFCWVVGALNEAYNAGWQDAKGKYASMTRG